MLSRLPVHPGIPHRRGRNHVPCSTPPPRRCPRRSVTWISSKPLLQPLGYMYTAITAAQAKAKVIATAAVSTNPA